MRTVTLLQPTPHWHYFFPILRAIVPSWDIRAPVLEVGHREGDLSEYLWGTNNWDGVEQSEQECSLARLRGTHNPTCGTVADMPFLADTYQTIIALHVMYHVKEGRFAALREMARVLAPGGNIYLTDVGHSFLDWGGNAQILKGLGAEGSTSSPLWYMDNAPRVGLEVAACDEYLSQSNCRAAYDAYQLAMVGGRLSWPGQGQFELHEARILTREREELPKGGGAYFWVRLAKPGSREAP